VESANKGLINSHSNPSSTGESSTAKIKKL